MNKIKNTRPKRRGSTTGAAIFGGVALLVLIMGVMAAAALNLLGYWGNTQGALAPLVLNSKISPEEMAARRAQADAQLNSYGWVDKNANIVRIPINQAMSLVADSGLPVGTPTPTPPPPLTPTPTATLTPTPVPVTPGAPTPEPTATFTVAATPTPVPTVNLANVSFKDNVQPIFAQHCSKCHGNDNPEEGLILTSYDGILTGSWNGSVVEPSNIENSYLIDQVVSGKMPKKGSRLTPEDISIISAWIEQGALNN